MGWGGVEGWAAGTYKDEGSRMLAVSSEARMIVVGGCCGLLLATQGGEGEKQRDKKERNNEKKEKEICSASKQEKRLKHDRNTYHFPGKRTKIRKDSLGIRKVTYDSRNFLYVLHDSKHIRGVPTSEGY